MRSRHILHLGLGESLRNRYLVCYDVSDPQRLIQTYKKMNGYGEPVQYSVFVCDLNDKELIIMREDLEELLNLADDRVLIVDVGPADTSGDKLSTIGAPLHVQREAAIVI